jgi:hypothetical protein
LSRLRMTMLLALAAILGGCEFFTGETKRQPQPMEFSYFSPYPTVHIVAIAPAINLSGSRDFDPLVVSDILYAEAQQVHNLNVLPVNKTLLAMQHLGMRAIDDAPAAQRLAQYLGADGLIIPAVTAYSPYNPPVVGMVLQMYTPTSVASAQAPAATAPGDDALVHIAANMGTVHANPDHPTVVADVTPTPVPPSTDRQPVSQVSAVFNATNQSVLRELETFAKGRTQFDSAMMDQKFLQDSEAYMRFVCNSMMRRLMDVEGQRVAAR